MDHFTQKVSQMQKYNSSTAL